MKNKPIHLILAMLLGSFAFFSCTKEPAVQPNAHFTTSLVDNTAYAGESFNIYFTQTSGDFYALYDGMSASSTYDPEDHSKVGVNIVNTTDSLSMNYRNPGEFDITLVASSSGNWAEDYLTDVYSMHITVVDRRTGFKSFSIDGVDGVFSPDGTEIIFQGVKNEDLTAKKPKFTTVSRDAVVTVNGQPQESGKTVQNFSAVNPGDSEGRSVVYTVTALNGDTQTYTVKYKLSDPSSDTNLYGLTSNINATFNINVDSSTVEMVYYANTNPASFQLQASAGTGAIVTVGTAEIQAKAKSVNLVTNPVIKVKAQNGTEKDYQVTLTPVDVFTSFKFTQVADDQDNLTDLFPVPTATINATAKTIDIKVSDFDATGTNNRLVATFEGINNQTVKIGDSNTTLESGTTIYTYDKTPVQLKLYNGTRLMDTYTLTINSGK